MKRIGPLVTLLVGFATAVVLVVLSINAASKDEARTTAANNAAATAEVPAEAPAAAASGSAPASPSPSAPPKASAPPAKVAPITWAGTVIGSQATIAIVNDNGVAIAYFCDGVRTEAWLKGTAKAGVLNLTGKNGAVLRATVANGFATGYVTVNGKRWNFKAPLVKKPSGLYRATANIRNAKVVGGWIVLPNGRQVGLANIGGTPADAGQLNTSTGASTVNGDPVTAEPVDGDSL